MKPQAAIRALAHLIAIKQPTFLWGPPGVGKSSIVRQVAEAYGGFIDLRLVQLDIIDLRGVLTIEKGKAVWAPPAMLPTKGKGVLLLDEFVQALPLMQNTASQLILDRRIGDYVLPDGWVVLAAGNRDGDRAATNKMPSHLANRFTHINIEVDYEDWRAWALASKINPMVIAFLGFRPALMHVFNPAEKAFPSPRSWEFVSKIVSNGVDDETMIEVVSGTVGEAAAKEFVGFVRVFRDLPDYEEIVKSPGSVDMPTNAAALYAIATMIGTRITMRDMRQVFKYVARMPEEFQVLCTRTFDRNPELIETATYIQWASTHKDLLLNRA